MKEKASKLTDYLHENRHIYKVTLSNLMTKIPPKFCKELLNDLVEQYDYPTPSTITSLFELNSNSILLCELNLNLPPSREFLPSTNGYIKILELINEDLNYILPLKDLLYKMNDDIKKFLTSENYDNEAAHILLFKINNTLADNKEILKYISSTHYDNSIKNLMLNLIGQETYNLEVYMNKLVNIEEDNLCQKEATRITAEDASSGPYLKYNFSLARIFENKQMQSLKETQNLILQLNLVMKNFIETNKVVDDEKKIVDLVYKLNDSLSKGSYDDYLSDFTHHIFTNKIIEVLAPDVFEMQKLLDQLTSIPGYPSEFSTFSSGLYLVAFISKNFTNKITLINNKTGKISLSDSEKIDLEKVDYEELVDKFIPKENSENTLINKDEQLPINLVGNNSDSESTNNM